MGTGGPPVLVADFEGALLGLCGLQVQVVRSDLHHLPGLRVADLPPVSLLLRVHRAVPPPRGRRGLRLQLRDVPLRLGVREGAARGQGADRESVVAPQPAGGPGKLPQLPLRTQQEHHLAVGGAN